MSGSDGADALKTAACLGDYSKHIEAYDGMTNNDPDRET